MWNTFLEHCNKIFNEIWNKCKIKQACETVVDKFAKAMLQKMLWVIENWFVDFMEIRKSISQKNKNKSQIADCSLLIRTHYDEFPNCVANTSSATSEHSFFCHRAFCFDVKKWVILDWGCYNYSVYIWSREN